MLLLGSHTLMSQSDTVFIRYDIDETGESISYTTDTVLFGSRLARQFLIGTTFLPYSHNNLSARIHGLDFLKVTKSDCQRDVTEYGGDIQDHINTIVTTDSMLTIDFNLYDNCCYEFICDASVDDEGILNLIYTGYGSYCGCDCCFGLTYHFSVSEVEGEAELKAVMLNGNRKTLKSIVKK